jgi:L-malate glycosyltransferase
VPDSRVTVAHVIHDLRPGGTERRLLVLLRELDRSRFDPLLVCVDALGPLVHEARELGLEQVVLGRSRRFDARGVWRLAELLRRRRVQIVHGWLSLANGFGRLAGALASVPVRVAGEGGSITTTSRSRGRRDALIDRMLEPLTDAYVANSAAVAGSLKRKGVPAEKIVVIPNGVVVSAPPSTAQREELRSELRAGDGDELVGMVSRLDPEFKDHETFLASVAALVREGRPVRAAIVGDGPTSAILQRRARELEISDRVVFTGYRADASALMAAFDVSALLSYSEGFSNVLLESMAAGVATVATSIPPNLEALDDGVHGVLVPVRDEAATIAALRRLLDDRALAAELGQAARRRVLDRFSAEGQAAATRELYERLLRERAATL